MIPFQIQQAPPHPPGANRPCFLGAPCWPGKWRHGGNGSYLGVFLAARVLALGSPSSSSVTSNLPLTVRVISEPIEVLRCSRPGPGPGCPRCSLSPRRTECTTRGAKAFWCRRAGLSLQPIWKTRTRKELRDPFWAQVSASAGPCLGPVRISLPPSAWRLLLESSGVGGGSLGSGISS